MDQNPIEKVAVIAVHGVGQQKPVETSRAIADMLSRVSQQTDSKFRYDAFTKNDLTIPVEHKWPMGGPNTPDVKFSMESIGQLKATDDLLRYETTSFHSQVRVAEKTSNVDIFELYWNDLSHAPSTFAKFLAELYQVFFHLASLGRKSVRFATDTAAVVGEVGRWLRYVRWCHDAMQRLLPTTVPILNLFLLASALPIAVLAIPESLHWPLAAVLAFLITAMPLSICLSRTRLGKVGIAISILAGAVTVIAMKVFWHKNATALLMVAILASGLWVAWKGSRALLERYQPSMRRFAPLVALGISVALLCYGLPWGILTGNSQLNDALLASAAFSVYGNFGLLQFAWLLIFLFSLPIIVSPLIQWLIRGKDNEAVIRALQTGRLGVMLSANLFFLTTSILWAALLKLTNPIFLGVAHVNISTPLGLMHSNIADMSGDNSLYDFSSKLYQLTVGEGANAYLVLVLAAVVIAFVGVFPSAMSEGNLPSRASVKHVQGMASWLNGAFAFFRVSEWLLIAAWVMLAVGYTTLIPRIVAGHSWIIDLGIVLAASVPALLLGRKLLPRGLSQVLDIVLDVSNWLKERPMDINPRGRILVRYLSLLKYLSKSGYKRIVVVSHSQGTVVTIDCLRFLKQSHDIKRSVFGDSQPSIELVTVGSPLRQLYQKRFPHQYGWVVGTNNGPAVTELAFVQHWINGYRSGDYVGRTLWSTPTPGGMIPTEMIDMTAPVPPFCDICLGAGAHLHYFDGSSKVIGTVVTKLILQE